MAIAVQIGRLAEFFCALKQQCRREKEGETEKSEKNLSRGGMKREAQCLLRTLCGDMSQDILQ